MHKQYAQTRMQTLLAVLAVLLLTLVLPLGRRDPEAAVGLMHGDISTLRIFVGTVAGGSGEAAGRLHTQKSHHYVKGKQTNNNPIIQ